MHALVIHVPHASTEVPAEALPDFRCDAATLRRFMGRITDHYTDELFVVDAPGVTTVRHDVSRIVVDPERYEDDAEERMAARGYGVLYERDDLGAPMRPAPSAARREWLLERWYRPHHRRLTEAVGSGLEAFGRVLIIDAHSYPAEPLVFDEDQRQPRPDACIGTCAGHTPHELIDAAREVCGLRGWSLGVDRPYAGSIVPTAFLGNAGVQTVMIEINRDRYMRLNGDDPERTEGYASTKAFVGGLIGALRIASERSAASGPRIES